MIDDKIIDFEARKDRRTQDEIDRDEARSYNVGLELFEVMAKSELSDTAITSVTLRALLERLEAGMSRHDAKARIAGSLKAFAE